MAEPEDLFQQRLSDVFGSLTSGIKTASNPVLKSDPTDSPSPTREDDRERYRERGEPGDHSRKTRRDVRFRGIRGSRAYHRPGQHAQPIPDYKVNPHKWKKYDLTDDGSESLSLAGLSDEQINKRAAFQFLSNLKSRKREEEGESMEVEEMDSNTKTIVFKKPKTKPKAATDTKDSQTPQLHSATDSDTRTSTGTDSSTGDKGSYKGGVYVMPEYSVGSSDRRTTKRKQPTSSNSSTSSNKSLHLDHLYDDDDEEI